MQRWTPGPGLGEFLEPARKPSLASALKSDCLVRNCCTCEELLEGQLPGELPCGLLIEASACGSVSRDLQARLLFSNLALLDPAKIERRMTRLRCSLLNGACGLCVAR